MTTSTLLMPARRAFVASVPLLVLLQVSAAHAQSEPAKADTPPVTTPTGATAASAIGGDATKSVAPGATAEATKPAEAKPESKTDVAPATVAPESVVSKAAKAGPGGSFMDTRLTWTFGDDDVLHRTGATQPLSPLPNIGDRPGYRLFFDNLNSRFTGRENVSHLVMYRKMPGFIKNLDTEAALVLRFDVQELAGNNQNVNKALYDSGSYLRMFYQTGEHTAHDGKKAKEGLGLVFFPLDTDRFRLGYLYEISWGGTNASRNESIFPRLSGSSPGLKMQYDGNGFYLFGGFKTAQIVQPQVNLRPGGTGNEVEVVRVAETNYGFLGGGGADLGPLFHADVGVGYFQQGRFEFPDLRPPPDTDRQAPRVFTYGGSGRLVFHKDMPTPQSIDFLLYRNDPNAPMQLFKPEVYKADEFAYSVSLEASQLHQNLHDPDPNKTGATTIQAARAAAIQGVIKAGYTRVSLAGILRDLPFVLRNVPSFVPFEALDGNSTKTQNEMFFAASIDHYLESLHLRPGIGGGVQLPATFSSESTVGNADAGRTVVVRSQGNVSILPLGATRKPIFQTRASLRWDISEIFAAVAWVQLQYDPDATIVTRDPTEGTVGIRTFQSSTFMGFGTTLQARY